MEISAVIICGCTFFKYIYKFNQTKVRTIFMKTMAMSKNQETVMREQNTLHRLMAYQKKADAIKRGKPNRHMIRRG